MEIFTFNKTMIVAKEAEFMKQKELELLREMEKIIKDNWQRENDILLVTNPNEEKMDTIINRLHKHTL